MCIAYQFCGVCWNIFHPIYMRNFIAENLNSNVLRQRQGVTEFGASSAIEIYVQFSAGRRRPMGNEHASR